jgi:addiction module HigA family antidote
MTTTKRKPTHPGIILLEEVIKPLNFTIKDAAEYLGVSRKTLSELVNCRSGLSPEMAVRIAKATGTSPESWYNLQVNLNLWEAKNNEPKDVKSFPKTA